MTDAWDADLDRLKKRTKTMEACYVRLSTPLKHIMEAFVAHKEGLISEHGTFTTARYQRGEKWSKTKQHLLFRSYKEGVSPGTLTVYTTSKKDDTYVVIDGQQRLCAMHAMCFRPKEFVISRKCTADWLATRGLLPTVQSWLAGLDDLNIFQFRELLKATHASTSLAAYIGRSRGDHRRMTTTAMANEIQQALLEETDILNIQAQFDHYFGRRNSTLMADVFDRLNDAGTALTEWEIAAALFSNEEKRLIPCLVARCREYIASSDKTLTVDFDIRSTTFSFHEFLSGICLVLWSEFPILGQLKKQTQSHDQQVMLFNKIFLIIHGKTKYATLHNVIAWDTLDAQTALLDKFRVALREVVRVVQPLLSPPSIHHDSPRLPCKGKEPIAINCFLSHVASFFVHADDGCMLTNLRKNALGHMLLEIVGGAEVVYQNAHHILHYHRRVHDAQYAYPVPLPRLATMLNAHVARCGQTPMGKQRNINTRSKVIVNLLSHAIARSTGERYDYEHMVSWKRCGTLRDGGVAADHLGNVALLALGPNRSKGAKTILEAIRAVHDGMPVSDQAFEDRWFCTPRALEVASTDPASFRTFSQRRAASIVDRVLAIF